MWISRKEYKFLKENAEKNINAECEILTAKYNKDIAVARAMEEYSAVLKERDELKQRVIELENRIDKTIKMREATQEEGHNIQEYMNYDVNHYPCATCNHGWSSFSMKECNHVVTIAQNLKNIVEETLANKNTNFK